MSFSDAVDNRDKVESVVKEESTTVESDMESSTVKTTTVGYVEITEKAQEKHFQTVYSEFESSQTDINITSKIKNCCNINS